jgi:hypothetical protein
MWLFSCGCMYIKIKIFNKFIWEIILQQKQHDDEKEYLVEDSGGNPYKVVCDNIDGKLIVDIYASDIDACENYNDYMFKKHILFTYYPQKIFIGHDPIIKCRDGCYDRWDGNSILLHMESNRYIHISQKI